MHLLAGSSQLSATIERFGLARHSQDLIVDDGDHSPPGQERTLLALWPYVRTGGYYVIEDIATGANRATGGYRGPLEASGSAPMVHRPQQMSVQARRILRDNHVIFVDSSAGSPVHGAFVERMRRSPLTRGYTKADASDAVNHLSHVLVIRKREHTASTLR